MKKDNSAMVRIIHEWDGLNSLMTWISNPNELIMMDGRTKGHTQETYQRLQAHAYSVGLDVTIAPEYNSKLVVTLIILWCKEDTCK